MHIFEMESSKKGSYFLAAEFKKIVAVYESSTGRKLGEYNTHFESGGKRMCIAESGKYFAAAAYGRFGITLFSTETGEAIWTTKEIKRIQQICFSSDDTLIFVINDDNRLYTLSSADGSIVTVEKSIVKIFSDSTHEVKLTSHGNLTWNGGSASLKDNKILCLCSGNSRVFCTIMGGGMKCFSDNGNVLWKAKNKPNEHYVKLCYNQKYDYIIGLGFKYSSARKEPFYFLDVYSAENGTVVYTVGLNDNSQYTFINNGERVVSAIGNVYILEKDGYILKEKQFEI